MPNHAARPNLPAANAAILVLCNAPDNAVAKRIAQALLAERLAACVSIQAPCHSMYRWQGQVEQATEIPLVIKTTLTHYAAVQAKIQALHPYELPEIVSVCIEHGLPAYLAWLAAETLHTV